MVKVKKSLTAGYSDTENAERDQRGLIPGLTKILACLNFYSSGAVTLLQTYCWSSNEKAWEINNVAYALSDIMTSPCITAPFCLETVDFILSFLCDCAFILTLNTAVFAWPPLLFPRGL